MQTRPHHDRWSGWRLGLACGAFACSYGGLLAVAYVAASVPGSTGTLWWPPAGLAVGVLVLTPSRAWPALLATMFAVSFLLGIVGIPPQRTLTGEVSFVWSIANVLSPLAGAAFFRRYADPPYDLRSLRNVVLLVGPAALATSMVDFAGSMFGWLLWDRTRPSLPSGPTFMSAALGVVTIAPLLLTATREECALRKRPVETITFAASLLLIAWAMFRLPTEGARLVALAGATFPLLAWAAVRFGPRGAAWASFLLTAFATWRTRLGEGPFGGSFDAPIERMTYVVTFFALATISSLVLAAVAAERRESARQTLRLQRGLQAALRETQEAVRLRDDFLSVASHELKTPLTPLSARLALMQRRAEAGEPIEPATIARARASLRKLVLLVDELLDVTNIRAAAPRTQWASCSLREIADVAIAPFRARSTLHRLDVVLPDGALPVFCDRANLARVMENLLDNAFKYSPAGGRVSVRLAEEEGEAVLTISDEGIGIPQAEQGGLFRRFSRATNAPSRSFGGLGIGLYMSREIVEQHGGHVTVTSVEGHGSTFTLRLPLVEAAAPDLHA